MTHPLTLLALLAPLVLGVGCRNKDDTAAQDSAVVDVDLDGWAVDEDCDDTDPSVSPDAPETPYDGVDNDCDPATPDDDLDGDGHGVATDCDDTDDSVSPDATEACNGIDDDCSGEVDDAVGDTWYVDADGDGYGDASVSVQSCDGDEGIVADSTDCDDDRDDVYPDAAEICDDADQDCDGDVDEDVQTTFYTDADGDGFGDALTGADACAPGTDQVSDASDCDDTERTVSPAATEVCDSVDNDCDGLVDDDDDDVTGTTTWHSDVDGDGHGDAAASTQACEQPADTVASDGDCDDADASVNPDAAETCNETDDDCDRSVDEDATDAGVWYADIDGDGHGDPDSSSLACSAPSDSVEDATDCDDTDASVSPIATELCDGTDNDCDGDVDEDDAADAETWFADADGDGFGDPDDTTTACDTPSTHVADDSDCDDANAAINTDAAETCDSADNDCDGLVDDDDPDALTLTWYIDHDGDGYGSTDYTVSACSEPSGFSSGSSDCDDTAGDVHPGALEVCDGADTDCNGTVDDATSGPTWYLDADGDGYGDADSTTEACSAPSGYVEDYTDCDDTDASVFPEPGGCSQGLSCLDILDKGDSVGDGPYTIDPDGSGTGVDPFDVSCDMTTDGGGWTAIDYADDLAYGTWFTGGDTYTWLALDFTFAASDDQIAALQALSTEGTQTYVGLCEHVIHYYYDDGASYDYAFGFRFFDDTEIAPATGSYSPYDIAVTSDGCAGNGGEGGDPSLATTFEVSSVLVPLLNVQARDAGDSGEYYGSPLTDNPAWLR